MLFSDESLGPFAFDHGPQAFARALLRRAVRQLALLRATSAGLTYAPTLDDRLGSVDRARERLLQLECAGGYYAELTGADLLRDAERMLAELPPPSSWREAALGQLLLSLAARVEFEAPGPSSDRLARALACETEHVNAARAALAELAPWQRPLSEDLQAFMTRWLAVAYGTLERASEGAYTRELSSVLERLGIRFTRRSTRDRRS